MSQISGTATVKIKRIRKICWINWLKNYFLKIPIITKKFLICKRFLCLRFDKTTHYFYQNKEKCWQEQQAKAEIFPTSVQFKKDIIEVGASGNYCGLLSKLFKVWQSYQISWKLLFWKSNVAFTCSKSRVTVTAKTVMVILKLCLLEYCLSYDPDLHGHTKRKCKLCTRHSPPFGRSGGNIWIRHNPTWFVWKKKLLPNGRRCLISIFMIIIFL